MNHHIIILYEKEQVPSLKLFLSGIDTSERENYKIIPMRADIELLLKEAEITYESGGRFRSRDATKRLDWVERTVSGLVDSPELSFFSHKNINLIKLHQGIIEDYFLKLLYCILFACYHPHDDQVFLWCIHQL
jgi:hypothetical protein